MVVYMDLYFIQCAVIQSSHSFVFSFVFSLFTLILVFFQLDQHSFPQASSRAFGHILIIFCAFFSYMAKKKKVYGSSCTFLFPAWESTISPLSHDGFKWNKVLRNQYPCVCSSHLKGHSINYSLLDDVILVGPMDHMVMALLCGLPGQRKCYTLSYVGDLDSLSSWMMMLHKIL